LYEWQMRWIEQVVRPTEAQRAALNDLQSASSKAIATMATACKAEMPTTRKAGLEMMDNRLEIMSQAVKTLRPAFDAFYASLDRQQQQRLDVFGPRDRACGWGSRAALVSWWPQAGARDVIPRDDGTRFNLIYVRFASD